MAIYYIRTSGSDSNDGTSPSTAWRNFSKALGSAGISSGDTVYIGAGTYRDVVVVGMTSATVETFIIGDVSGIYTGDAGEVKLTGSLQNNKSTPSNKIVLDLSGRDFLTFRNINFTSNSASQLIVSATTATSISIKFINCCFILITSGALNQINITIGFGNNANWLIEKCIFYSNSSSSSINIALATGAGNDYNANIIIRSCVFHCCGGIVVTSSGSSANEGGNVIVTNCTFTQLGSGNAVQTSTSRVGGQNFTYPVKVFNCFISSRSNVAAISAGELGALIENYNVIIAGTPIRTNVAIGPQTISDQSIAPSFSVGQEALMGTALRPYFMPMKDSPLLNFGNATIVPTDDLLNNPYSLGSNSFLYGGTATSATSLSLTDTSKNFLSGSLNGAMIKIIEGAGKDQIKTIWANTNNTISGDGPWLSNPNSTSKYIIYNGQITSSGPVSGDTTPYKITSSGSQWGNNFWAGFTCEITSGTSKGSNFIVSGNSPTSLTGYYSMNVIPASGDAYSIYWGAILKSTVSSATSITLTDNQANWPQYGGSGGITGFWNNWTCMIISGSGSGANFVISGHSATVLSGWNTLSIIPASGDQYVIYQGAGPLTGYSLSSDVPNYGQGFLQCAVGCYGRNNTAIQETGIVKSGDNSLQIFGPGSQDFYVPISGNTTISVMAYFDDQYSGIKPQLVLYGGSGISVPDTTGIMAGNSGQWEQITLTVNSASVGYINVQLRSNTTGLGSAYFDSFSIV